MIKLLQRHRIANHARQDRSVKRSGYSLIEQLARILVMSITLLAWTSVSARYGKLLGTAVAFLTGSLSVVMVAQYYRWTGRLNERNLRDAREKCRDIYRVIAYPTDPSVIVLPEGAEIRVGDYGWEAGPSRNDGLIYLQGMTPDWTVVWHAGFHANEIEKICKKPLSQYDSWHPYWADPPKISLCPYPVVERETMTIGRPHHSNRYVVEPMAYHPRKATLNGADAESVERRHPSPK